MKNAGAQAGGGGSQMRTDAGAFCEGDVGMSDRTGLGWAMRALCVVACATADVRAQAPPNSWWDRYRGDAP